jgi:Fe-S cluster assembly protein SufD
MQMASSWEALVDLPNAPAWLMERRYEAWAKLQSVGWPTKHDGRYANTSLAALEGGIDPATPGTVELADFQHFLTGDELARIVFVDGQYAAELSLVPSGLVAGPMALSYEYPSTQHHFQALAASDDPLELLQCATWQDGAFVLAEDNTKGTVHIIHVNTGVGGLRNLHHAIVTDGTSELQLLESHVHLADDAGTTLSFAVMVAGNNTSIQHIKVQKEDRRAQHFATQRNLVLGDARLHSTLIDIGGASVRQASTGSLVGPNAEVALHGVFFGQRQQRKHIWTRVDHVVPHCRSDELFKGIMDDESRGMFTGLIKVHAGAHHSASEQENRNLLLSNKAHIDARPQLEIDNDDVTASHGSTIGQLEEDQLFFLRARGIGNERARMMLTRAFASQVLEEVKDGSIRQLLDRYLHTWFIKHQEHLVPEAA